MADLTVSMLAVIVLAAFVPSLLIMLYVKNAERGLREPTIRVLFAFLSGATISVFLAIAIEVILIYLLLQEDLLRVSDIFGRSPELTTVLLACVIAPFAEELTKAFGILPYARRSRELEDGIVYGAAVGLGFAATENLFYETSSFLEGGITLFIGTVILRTIASTLLHASASAITGYGLSLRSKLARSWVPYYLTAVALHAVFNLSASAGQLFESSLGEYGYLIGLVAAIVIAGGAFRWSRRKIARIELRS